MSDRPPRGLPLPAIVYWYLAHRAEHVGACLVYRGPHAKSEYSSDRAPQVTIQGRTKFLYHFVCEVFHGPPDGEHTAVRHLCHNSHCLNPLHLRWGTAKQNMRDTAALRRKLLKAYYDNRAMMVADLLASGVEVRTLAWALREHGAPHGRYADDEYRRLSRARVYQLRDRGKKLLAELGLVPGVDPPLLYDQEEQP